MALTRRQREIYEFIEGFINSKGYSPSFDEIRLALNLNSLATIHKHIQRMRKRGLVSMPFDGKRSIEVLPIKGSFKRDLLKEIRELREQVAELQQWRKAV